ncbi:MAG: Hsp33 family molecular chaperone [Pseudomonadota bacterium]|nr:Hsp33 family molecular chaperone [Pseudomonadota bacterium]
MDNISLPYKIENVSAHGRVVRLGSVINEILSRHDYPEPVSALLGEAVVLTAMMASILKFEGRFVIQTQSDGPVSMLVCDARADGSLRGYAKLDEEAFAALGDSPTQQDMLGAGHIAFTVDQGADMERYQGIVPLEDNLLTAALTYFSGSEQVQTHVKLTAMPLFRPGGDMEWRAGGIMIQQTALQGGSDTGRTSTHDDWVRMQTLMETTKPDELLDPELSPEQLVYRLYNEDGVRVFDVKDFSFNCGCSRTRIQNMLNSFPEEDILSMQEDGHVTVTCEFCSEVYQFDAQLLKDVPIT